MGLKLNAYLYHLEKPKSHSFQQRKPSDALSEFVGVYFEAVNLTDQPEKLSIFPDSFFKLIVQLVDGKIVAYFLTGLWANEVEIVIPPRARVFGIKFKILAPEYVFNRSLVSIYQTFEEQDLSFWNMNNFEFTDFKTVVNQFESVIQEQLKLTKKVNPKKSALSALLYKMNGQITVEEVSNQIGWSTTQINRYLNSYLGVSLKKYLSFQKVFASYIQIIEGRFFPDEGYYDQAHFIKEMKKHTNYTPKELHKEKDTRFIQLKNIRKK